MTHYNRIHISPDASLGAIPAIVLQISGTILMSYLTYKMSAGASVAAAAKEYQEFKEMQEEILMQIALQLGRETDIPYWTWYNILRWVQIEGTEPGPGDVPDLPPERRSSMTTWIIVGGVVLAAVIITRK